MEDKNVKKEVIKRAILGFMTGIFVGHTISILESLITHDGNFYAVSAALVELTGTNLGAVIVQYFLTGIMGAVFASSSIIFEMDEWSLLRQTATHFVIVSVLSYIAGFLCRWFPHTVGSTLIWFGVFIVVYIIFWVCFMLYYKNKVKKINEAL